MKRIKNATPKSYKVFYITPGLADYTAEGIGTVLVQKLALDRIAPTYVGKPVVNLEHTDKEPEELFELSKNSKPEDFADGIITAVGFDEKTGWHWMDVLIWDSETIDNIDKRGFSASCAYDVTESIGEGGTYNNVPYQEEVLDGSGLHLAIVPNPRYEKAYIIKNSKTKGEGLKIKFLQKRKPLKNQAPEKKPDEEEVVVENAEDGMVDLGDGEEMSLSELVAMYKEKKGADLENAGKKFNMDDEVEVDGEKMSIRDMVNMCKDDTLQNAEDPQDEKSEVVVDETLQNSVNKKKGQENFNKIKNAASSASEDIKRNLNTQSERLAKGKARYSSKVQQGGK